MNRSIERVKVLRLREHITLLEAAYFVVATPGGLVLAPASLPARGHSGVRARREVPPQARGAARCRRKWTLDPPHRLLHTQPRAVEMTIRHSRKVGMRPTPPVTYQLDAP